jgi:hypothetical protein
MFWGKRPAVAPQLKGIGVSEPGKTHASPSGRLSTFGTRSRYFVATLDVHTAEIGDIVNRYADGVRLGDADMILSCFSDDASADYGHVTLNGSDEIRAYFSQLAIRPATTSTPSVQRVASTPVMTNVVIELHGDTAHSESMCLAIHAGYREGEGTVTVRGTRNIDDLVRTAAGWRISRREHVVVWSFDAPATSMAPAH